MKENNSHYNQKSNKNDNIHPPWQPFVIKVRFGRFASLHKFFFSIMSVHCITATRASISKLRLLPSVIADRAFYRCEKTSTMRANTSITLYFFSTILTKEFRNAIAILFHNIKTPQLKILTKSDYLPQEAQEAEPQEEQAEEAGFWLSLDFGILESLA